MKTTRSERNSSIEVLRMLCMVLLIAHHLVVHGGSISLEGMTNNRILSLIILPAGKICFNCFVAISTWYLVKSEFRGVKFLKVWLQVLFYNVFFLGAAVLLGGVEAEISWKTWIGSLFPILGNSHGYAASYLAFYLLVPFLKILADRITRRQNAFLIVLLVLTQLCTVPFGQLIDYTQPMSSEILLFVLCFFISLYMQRYPFRLQNRKPLLALIVAACWGSAACCHILGANTGAWLPSFYAGVVAGSELSIVNVLGGYALFLIFYNIKMPVNNVVNRLATTTFGILLMHDHNYFRYVVWNTIVQVPAWSNGPTLIFIRNSIIAVAAIFVVGAAFDFARQKLLERPVFKSRAVTAAAKWLDGVLTGNAEASNDS